MKYNINELIIGNYQKQHDGREINKHWHLGDQNKESRNKKMPSNLLADKLLTCNPSEIIFNILENEFKVGNYILGSGKLENGLIDACIKIYPSENLSSNNLYFKSYSPVDFEKKTNLALFSQNTGYLINLEGKHKKIKYHKKLGNITLKENIYKFYTRKITISYYDFDTKKICIKKAIIKK